MIHHRWQLPRATATAAVLLSTHLASPSQWVRPGPGQHNTDATTPVRFLPTSDDAWTAAPACTTGRSLHNAGATSGDALHTIDATRLGACGDPATLIHEVQGAGERSPISGRLTVIEGVVVGDFQDAPIDGLFVQEEDSDADDDPRTSEGIFVFGADIPADEGDTVRIRGTVAEYSKLTELTRVTELVVCSRHTSTAASAAVVTLPVASAQAFEALEGMLVRFSQTLTVTDNADLGRFGSLGLSWPDRLWQPTQIVEPGAPARALRDINARSRITLDDLDMQRYPAPVPYRGRYNTRRVGDRVAAGLTGIISGRFGTYRVQPTKPVTFISGNPRPSALPATGGDIQVASFNLLNFFTTIDNGDKRCGPSQRLACRGADSRVEFKRQREKLLNALQTMNADIIGLNELENNDRTSLKSLVDGLNARMGSRTYEAVHSTSIGKDAIKVGLLYKPEAVVPVGTDAVLDASVDQRFKDTKSRPVLAQTFDEVSSGERFSVVVLHLKSKGSPCDDIGDPDTGDLSGNCNKTRTLAVQALVDWLHSDPTHSKDTDILVIGDFNAYAKEDPIDAMKAGGYRELVDAFIGVGKASSFVFRGESGYLDHAFASRSLAAQVTGVVEWHHNSDEPPVLDYNLESKSEDLFNINDPFRASDHDSLLVGLQLSPTAGGRTPRLNRARTARQAPR